MSNYDATNYAVANWASLVSSTEGAFLRGTSQIKKVIRGTVQIRKAIRGTVQIKKVKRGTVQILHDTV